MVAGIWQKPGKQKYLNEKLSQYGSGLGGDSVYGREGSLHEEGMEDEAL